MDHNDSLTFDLGALWRNQKTTSYSTSLEEMRRRAQQSEAHRRRGAALLVGAVLVHAANHVLRHFMEQPEFIGWMGVLEFTTLVILVAYWPHQPWGNAHWPPRIVPRQEPVPGLQFYRSQLENRLRLVRGDGAALRFLIVIAAFFVHAVRYPALMALAGVPLIAFTILLYARRRLEFPLIQRELEDLKVFLKETNS